MCFWSVTRIVGSWAYKGLRGPAFPLSLSSGSGLPYPLLSYPSTSSPKLKMGGLLYIYRLGSLSEFSSPSSPRPCSHSSPCPQLSQPSLRSSCLVFALALPLPSIRLSTPVSSIHSHSTIPTLASHQARWSSSRCR